MVLADQLAVTPAGKPTAVPIPVAPVVVCVILVKAVFKHKVGAEDAVVTVFSETTLISWLASVLHPLLSVTVTL